MANTFPFDMKPAQAMHEAFWANENHERPVITASIRKPGAQPAPPPRDLEQQWLDAEYVVSTELHNMRNTLYAGDALPILCPNVGPDFMGGVCGCDITFSPTTSWATHFVEDWAGLPPLAFDETNRWWQKTQEITDLAMRRAQGEYLVGITDIHAGLDGLVSMRGPEEVCYDLVDEPEMIQRRVFEMYDVFKQVMARSKRLTAAQQGTTNWMRIWHPNTWYVTSCDTIGMISKDMFETFVLPELLEELDYLDASMFHLDGVGALKHLDRLLEIPKLNGIQWVYGAGQPSAAHWLDVLGRIQAAGKCIQVIIQPEEIVTLCEHLRPEGVMYCVDCTSAEEADWVVKQAAEVSRKWR